MSKDRRHPRFTLEGVQGSLGLRAQVRLVDLSLGGAALRTNRGLRTGAEFVLRFDLEWESVSVRAVVVRSGLSPALDEDGNPAPRYMAGLKFTGILAGKLQGLRRYIDETRAGDERRLGGARMQIKAPGEAILESLEICRVKLISLSGMLIVTDQRLEVEGVHPMEILPPGEETIGFQGRVASCHELVDKAPGRCEVGIGFLEMSPADTSRLKAFINSVARG